MLTLLLSTAVQAAVVPEIHTGIGTGHVGARGMGVSSAFQFALDLSPGLPQPELAASFAHLPGATVNTYALGVAFPLADALPLGPARVTAHAGVRSAYGWVVDQADGELALDAGFSWEILQIDAAGLGAGLQGRVGAAPFAKTNRTWSLVGVGLRFAGRQSLG